MEITIDTVKKLGHLAKMALTDQEAESLRGNMQDIIELVEQLNEVDTEGIEPLAQVTGLENVTREDSENYTFKKSDMLATMPDVDQQGNLRVHAVFTGDSPSN